jgi:hypothetical protein
LFIATLFTYRCAYSLRSYLLVHYVHYVAPLRSCRYAPYRCALCSTLCSLTIRSAHVRSLSLYYSALVTSFLVLRIFTTFIFARSLFAALIVHYLLAHRSALHSAPSACTYRCAHVALTCLATLDTRCPCHSVPCHRSCLAISRCARCLVTLIAALICP